MKKNVVSTPLSEVDKDTLLLDDNLITNDLIVEDNKPLLNQDEAEIKEKNTLIFGKFKTLDEAYKGYKEAEKAITKSAELEKQIKHYQEEAMLYEQDKIANEKGFSNRFDMALNADAWHRELDNYAIAACHLLSPQQQLEIRELIEKSYNSGSNEDIIQIRKYFSPEVIALVSQDTAMFKSWRKNEYDELLLQDKKNRYNRKIEEFKLLNNNWIDSDIKSDLLTQALELSDGRIDLLDLKKIVEKIEQNAIEKYLKTNTAKQENDFVQNSLIEPSGDNFPKSKKKKWLTKAEYYKLTPKEEAEKYDLIMEQVKLEKQGLLPRMLT